MSKRIMMQAAGATRALSFEQEGARTLLHDSRDTPWAGVQLEVHRTMPGEARENGPLEGEHALVVFLSGSIEMTTTKQGRVTTTRSRPGSTAFLGGEELRGTARIRGSSEVVAVKLEPEWFHRVGMDGAPKGFSRTPPLIGDETARALACAMRAEIEGGAGTGRLYAESLSMALLSYALERVPLSRMRMRVRGALSDEQRRRLSSHIRERLANDLSLRDLARLVGLSERQLSRLFRDAFGVTPHRYVLGARLEEGARRLAQGPQDIAEIALSLGFCSQSHFSAAFRARFGTTPRRYAVEHRSSRVVF